MGDSYTRLYNTQRYQIALLDSMLELDTAMAATQRAAGHYATSSRPAPENTKTRGYDSGIQVY